MEKQIIIIRALLKENESRADDMSFMVANKLIEEFEKLVKLIENK